MDEEKKEEKPATAPKSSEKNTGMAVLCYLGILVLVPMLTKDKSDPFVKFHIKQGLVLLVLWVIAAIVAIPLFAIIWIVYTILGILSIIGIINVLNGKEDKLPLVGQFGDKFNV